MATTIQLRRGTTAQVDAVTPASGEPIWETDGLKLAIGDGSTAGGLHVMMASGGTITGKVAITIPAAAITGEEHGLAVSYTGTLTSGDSIVAGNFAAVPEGTGGQWVSGIYAKVTQGATKAVNGYISGAEFEVINTADQVSDWFPLVLNAYNSGAQMGTHASFIALRDYGSLELNSLLWFGDQSIGTKSDTVLLTTFADGAHISHAIKMRIGDVDYWLLVSNVKPSTT